MNGSYSTDQNHGVMKAWVSHEICFLNSEDEPELCPLAPVLLSADTSSKIALTSPSCLNFFSFL